MQHTYQDSQMRLSQANQVHSATRKQQKKEFSSTQ